MNVSKSLVGSHRPDKLYLYGERVSIERACRLGELRLHPNAADGAPSRPMQEGQILPFGPRASPVSAGFLTLSLSSVWRETFFHEAQGAAACLVIRDPEEFGERLHRAVQKALPQWAGIDAAVAYGAPSPLGAAFTKGKHLSLQKEWLFAWRPIQATQALTSIVVQIGCMDSFTELREPGQFAQ